FRNLAEGVSAATGDAFFRSVVDYLAQSLAVEYAFVGELAGPHQHRIKTIIVHARGRIADNFEYDLQDTPCHNVVGQTLCCYPKNVQALFPKDALLADMKIESYIGTPLFNSQGQALGLMAVMGCRPLETPDLAASILQIFAARTSAKLERRQSETALKARAREQAALLNLSEDLVSTLDEADIYRKMLHGLHQTLGYDCLGLFLIDPATGDRLLFGSLGWPDVPEEWRIPPGHGVSERALLDGQLHYTPDVTRDPAYVPGLNSGAEIDVPIRAGAEIVGVLTVESKKPHAFGPHDFDVLNAAANQTALALQRAREHQAVKKAEARYRGLFNGMPVGLYRSTPDKKMLDANPALVQLFGFPDRETLLQTSIDDLYINPEDRRQWQTLLVTNNLVREFEVQLRRRDGSAIWVRDSARVVRDAAGTIMYYEGSLEDITERKQLEAQYLQAQKMEAVGRLTGGIAHDFNNLLTAINGFASILRREIPPHDPNHRMAGQILHAGERAADLVSQLLAFSRKQIIQPEVLNCNAVVTKMSQMLRRIIGEHIELHTGLATALWAVEIDPAQLEQVIVNLAVNARDAMPHGGRLAIQTANVLLSQKFAAAHPETEAGEYVLLSVADTGTGMTEAVKARVFEPFFTTKEMGRGTGLGLATVFGIIKQNRGE
ncbi:MAG: GAF domain-containing protein, partial [Anaerolineae bacterium]